jgi:hypothetical protein
MTTFLAVARYLIAFAKARYIGFVADRTFRCLPPHLQKIAREMEREREWGKAS